MANPTLHGPSYSTYARTVRLALEEKGVPYTLKEIDIMKGARTPEHLALHPWGKVPAFDHDGFKIFETEAITRYVDETFGGAKLQPASAKDRARMTQAISILDSYGYPSMISKVAIERMFSPKANEKAISEAMPDVNRTMDALENLIGENTFLIGENISLADLHAVPIFEYFSQTPEGKAAMAKRPKVAAWWNRIKDRPTVAKTRPQL
jgi:glutathione S-transferase